VLFRGCGLTDAFITSEPQVHHAAQLAYGLDAVPDDDALERLARSWRPFRTWVSVLITMNYYNATGGRAPTVRKRGAPGRKQRSLELSPAR
jgi:DNA-3-methyladenine glycosylase II